MKISWITVTLRQQLHLLGKQRCSDGLSESVFVCFPMTHSPMQVWNSFGGMEECSCSRPLGSALLEPKLAWLGWIHSEILEESKQYASFPPPENTPVLSSHSWSVHEWQECPISSALIPRVFTPLSSRTTWRPLEIPIEKFVACDFPVQIPSLITHCFPPGMGMGQVQNGLLYT